MHSTLGRQLAKYFHDLQVPPQDAQVWSEFLAAVSTTYEHYEQDHLLIERSLELSSKELTAQNVQLREQTQQLEGVKAKLEQQVLEIKEQKQRVDERRARDEALLSSIGEGMLATDKSGVIIMVNDAAVMLLQYDKPELIGQLVGKVIPDTTSGPGGHGLPFTDRLQRSVLQKGEKLVFSSVNADNVIFLRKDNSTVPVFVTATPVVSAGAPIGSVLIFRDATMDREIDRMKTEFISLASHQLRTPLSAIRWFSEMLLNGDAGQLSDEQKEFTKNIADSTVRMIDLVNALLNTSRMESGRIIIDPQPTDLTELVQEIISDLTAKTEEKEQILTVSVHKELQKINLDPHLISQVYMNFLTNAIKYTPKGGEISVIISRKGDAVISQISDNGLGIPKAQQGRVFQKFFRAENIAKVETDGTGLGLYLVKTIIESSGGKVWFESEEGKGSTFWFTLPLSGMTKKEGEVSLDD
jgi:PAS domain S-box-containing protein